MISVVVHEFKMGDVEDPDIYAAMPMMQWEKSAAGEFVMENSLKQPEWIRLTDAVSMGYLYRIVAYFDDKTHVLWKLKF
jgi:hypothetical protein